MPVEVIECLESVQIEEHDGKEMAPFACREFVLEKHPRVPAVRESSEVVRESEILNTRVLSVEEVRDPADPRCNHEVGHGRSM